MKSFDAFGRPVQEFQVKTACGGYLSVCSLFLVVMLFFSELSYFLQPETTDHMVVDAHQDQKLVSLTLNVTLPKAPCAVLGINLIDPKKANIMHVSTEMYKTRLSSSGQTLGPKIRESLTNTAQNALDAMEAGAKTDEVKASHATTHLRCPSCFQSHEDEDDCCATCEEVRAAFSTRGIASRGDYVFGQCVKEAYSAAGAQPEEGCRIEASLRLKKVPATLHVGVARRPDRDLVAGEWQAAVSHLDLGHTIDGLAFGPDFPGLVHVLDGRQKTGHHAPDSEHYLYKLQAIPTLYEEDGQDPIASHQYSVLEHVKAVDLASKAEDTMPAGLWLEYDFTPFEVRVTTSRKSMWHFLTECCAIMGGVFAFSGMLDNFAYQLNSRASGGRRKGGEIEMFAQ